MSNHTHDFPAWPFDCGVTTVTFCTAKVARAGYPVLHVSHDHDGDWQMLDDTTEFPGECVLRCLGCVFEQDASLAEVADLPLGWSAARDAVGEPWERWENPLEEDDDDEAEQSHPCNSAEADARALADIDLHGLHILNVGADGDLPPFSYSIGIEKSLGLPELIVIGLKPEVAQYAINECYAQMKTGARIVPGAYVEGLLGGGFKCYIGEMSPSRYKAYMGWALWLYKGNGFRAWQIVYPNTSGVFPWEPQTTDWFKNWQPILAAPI